MRVKTGLAKRLLPIQIGGAARIPWPVSRLQVVTESPLGHQIG